MPKVDLSQFATIDELKQQAKAIEAEIARRRDKAREEFYEQAKQVAAELEISVKELFGKPRKNTGRSTSRRSVKAADTSDGQQRRTQQKDNLPTTGNHTREQVKQREA